MSLAITRRFEAGDTSRGGGEVWQARRVVVVSVLLVVLSCLDVRAVYGQSKVVRNVGVGHLGDKWLESLRYQRIGRATRQTAEGRLFGYEVAYKLPGDRELIYFWPRAQIEFNKKSSSSRQRAMMLHGKRL